MLFRIITVLCKACRQQSIAQVAIERQDEPIQPQQAWCRSPLHHGITGAGRPVTETEIVSVTHEEHNPGLQYMLTEYGTEPLPKGAVELQLPSDWREREAEHNRQALEEHNRLNPPPTPEERAAAETAVGDYMRRRYGASAERAAGEDSGGGGLSTQQAV